MIYCVIGSLNCGGELDKHEHVEGVVGYGVGSLYIILGEDHRSMDKVWEGVQGGVERDVKLQLFFRFARDESEIFS